MVKSITDLTHVFYINLEKRPDRKRHIEAQLQKVGILCAERFNAISMTNGAVGCSMSHLKLLETAKANQWDHILIVEDDLLFVKPSVFRKQLSVFLATHDDYDVVMLAGNNIPPCVPVDSVCVQVRHCQTTTGYLVKQHYYDTLIANYREGIAHLLRQPEHHRLYAIDKYWFKLQAQDRWLLIIPLTVTQREDYSDIEQRQTNYTSAMLDLDKPYWGSKPRAIHDLKHMTLG